MRSYWIVFLLSALVALALLVVLTGQYQLVRILSNKLEKQEELSDKLYHDFSGEELFKGTLENLVNQAKRVVRDLVTEVDRLSMGMDSRRKDEEACQKEKKTISDQLTTTEKEIVTVKTESEAWKKELMSLSVQLKQRSLICNYVKKSNQSEKLCDLTKTNKTSV